VDERRFWHGTPILDLAQDAPKVAPVPAFEQTKQRERTA
jgi:hypothetical protein